MKKTVKICIYNKSSSKNDVLIGNGDAILDNICIECKVHENLDGTYEIDAEFIIDNEGLWENIEEESILKVRLDYGYEYFRITKPRKTSNRIIVYGRQVTIYETMHLWLTDVRPENQDGAGALHWILDNATGIKELEVMSDIETISTAYYMDMNMYEALHDCDQSFYNRWGGEIQRRGYTLRINQRIGADRGVEIRSRKNLIGFEAETNIDNVVTRIKPKGFDGITIDGYVDSEYINKYPRIKTKEIKYEKVKVKGENSDDGYETLAEAQAELTRLAKLEYTDNKIDVITAEYNISFIDLSKTEEYKEYVAAERVYLGDTVNVYEEKLDINVSVRAIDRVYDVLGERVEEIKLSNKDINKIHSMNDILTDILKGVQENDNSLQLYIQNIINSGIQDSYVFYNKAELVICDSPEIENAINVWRFNRGGLAHSSNGYSGPYNVAITYDGKINADMIIAGLLKGNYIDARNLSVTRADGTKTLEVTAGGDVNLDVTEFNVRNKSFEYYLYDDVNLIPNPSALYGIGTWTAAGTAGCSVYRYETTANYIPPVSGNTSPYISGDDLFGNAEIYGIVVPSGGLSMVIRDCTGKVIMIDGGYADEEANTIAVLNTLGVKKINYYIVTHSHSDHSGAVPKILDTFGAECVVIKESRWNELPAVEVEWETKQFYDSIINKCKELNIPVLNPTIDSYLKISDYSYIQIFNSNSTTNKDYNLQSLMCLYVYKDSKFFFAGDGIAEAALSPLNQVGKVDLLQLGHHGEGSWPQDQKLIDELQPKYAYYASNFLDVAFNGGTDPISTKVSLDRVSFWGGYSVTHGSHSNPGNVVFILDGINITTTANAIKSTSRWYLRDGEYYYFKSDSTLANNELQEIDNELYRFGEDKIMYRNKWFQDHDENWFYFGDNGVMYKNTTVTIDGKQYTFNSDGICINPNQ